MNKLEAFYAFVVATLMRLSERVYAAVPAYAGTAARRVEQALVTESMRTRGNRGQAAGGNLVALVVGIAVAVIVAVGVAIPITNDVIASSNLTGITATVVGFIPVMLGLLIFVATAAPIMRRT